MKKLLLLLCWLAVCPAAWADPMVNNGYGCPMQMQWINNGCYPYYGAIVKVGSVAGNASGDPGEPPCPGMSQLEFLKFDCSGNQISGPPIYVGASGTPTDPNAPISIAPDGSSATQAPPPPTPSQGGIPVYNPGPTGQWYGLTENGALTGEIMYQPAGGSGQFPITGVPGDPTLPTYGIEPIEPPGQIGPPNSTVGIGPGAGSGGLIGTSPVGGFNPVGTPVTTNPIWNPTPGDPALPTIPPAAGSGTSGMVPGGTTVPGDPSGTNNPIGFVGGSGTNSTGTGANNPTNGVNNGTFTQAATAAYTQSSLDTSGIISAINAANSAITGEATKINSSVNTVNGSVNALSNQLTGVVSAANILTNQGNFLLTNSFNTASNVYRMATNLEGIATNIAGLGTNLDAIQTNTANTANGISNIFAAMTNAAGLLSNAQASAMATMNGLTNGAAAVGFDSLASDVGSAFGNVSVGGGGGSIPGWTIGNTVTLTITPATPGEVAPVGVVHDLIAWFAYASLFLSSYKVFSASLRQLLLTPQVGTSGEAVLGTNLNFGSAIAMATLIVVTVATFTASMLPQLAAMLGHVTGNPFAAISSIAGWGVAMQCCPFDVVISCVVSFILFRTVCESAAMVTSGIIKFYVGL